MPYELTSFLISSVFEHLQNLQDTFSALNQYTILKKLIPSQIVLSETH